MGNHLCVIVNTKRKPVTKPTPPPTLKLETILENYVPPHGINHNTPVYTCEFCCESRPINDSFSPKGCCHFYCTKCTLKYIVSKLQDNILNLNCPEHECKGELSPHLCKQILPNRIFTWWERALCESVIPEKDKFYCPFSDCSALLLCSDLQQPRKGVTVRASVCPHCKRNVCVRCRAPWHAEASCHKFQKLRNKNDNLLLDLAKRRKWRQCPNCKHYVEKKQGCDDMTCRCLHRFCYNCGASISNHFGHDCFESDD